MSRTTPPLPHVPLWGAKGKPRPVVSMYVFLDITSYGIFGNLSISKYLMLMISQIFAHGSAHTRGDKTFFILKL